MRFNDKEIAKIAKRQGQLEGKLQHKEPPGSFRSGYRERFCKVVGNLFFIFRITELGTIENEPMGLIVLENYLVSTESDSMMSFAFGLTFRDDTEKRHIFTTRTELDAERWVRILREASYQHWKDQLNMLSQKVNSLKLQQLAAIPPSRTYPNQTNSLQSSSAPTVPPRPKTVAQKTPEKDLIIF